MAGASARPGTDRVRAGLPRPGATPKSDRTLVRVGDRRRFAPHSAESRPLDTLAQLRNSAVGILVKRAKRRYFSRPIAAMMADALNRRRGPALAAAYARGAYGSLQQSYRNTLFCCVALRQEDGKLAGHYCGNRWCLLCAAIRTGKAWNNYMPFLTTWPDKHFVTLTIQNVGANQLRGSIGEMLFALTWIKKEVRRRYGVELVGLRKLECTWNRQRGDFHPHFHLVLENGLMAWLVVGLWLEVWGEELANPKAQEIVEGDDGTVSEMFKYFTKLVTKRRMMAPPALDTIFCAMRNRRVFQSFGFTLPTDDEESALTFDQGTQAPTRRGETIVWDWMPSLTDWIDLETGDCLSGYEPGKVFKAFVESIG